MENPKHLKPFIAAFVGDWTWTIPDWRTWSASKPPGHVETSPEQCFVVLDQELRFAYELIVPQPGSGPSTRLINRSNRTVRVKTSTYPYETYIVKPGDRCQGPGITFHSFLDGPLNCRMAFNAHILLDFDVPSSLQRDFLALLDDPEKCDFTLICKDQKFPCHSFILKARTPVLAGAFESSEETDQLEIKGFEPSSVQKMVEFIYSDTISSDADADLLKLADYFNIQGLIKLSDQRLADAVSEDNVFDLLTLADCVPEAKVLKQTAMDFIIENYSQLKESPEWDQMSNRGLRDILDCMNSKLPKFTNNNF